MADDRVIAWAVAERVFGRAPAILKGLVELRGQTMSQAPAPPFAEIALVARLGAPGDRQPEPSFETLAGVRIPAVDIAPFEASGPARLRRIVEQITARL